MRPCTCPSYQQLPHRRCNPCPRCLEPGGEGGGPSRCRDAVEERGGELPPYNVMEKVGGRPQGSLRSSSSLPSRLHECPDHRQSRIRTLASQITFEAIILHITSVCRTVSSNAFNKV